MTIVEVWDKLDKNIAVYRKNVGYKVIIEEAKSDYHRRHFTHRDGSVLAIRYVENWFGGLMYEEELDDLFTKEVSTPTKENV